MASNDGGSGGDRRPQGGPGANEERVSGGAQAQHPDQGGLPSAGTSQNISLVSAQQETEAMDVQGELPANPAPAPNAVAQGGPTQAPSDGALSGGWVPVGTQRTAAAANAAPQLPVPLIDGCVFKARIHAMNRHHQVIAADADWHGYLNNDVQSRGVVAHFDNPENFLPRTLLTGYSEEHFPAPTLEQCKADETLVSDADILGAVIGVAPELAHHMTEEAWTYLEGQANKPEISGYKILGLTSGLDLSTLPATATREQELDLAVLQGSAVARMAAIAVRTGYPLVLKLLNSSNKHVDPFSWVMAILHRVPGWYAEQTVVITQFWGTADQARTWLLEHPRTWFGISNDYVNMAARDHESSALMQDIPWEFLIPESVTPLGSQRNEDWNDPSEILELVSSLAELTEEDENYIFQELARSAVRAYDLDVDHPDILNRTRAVQRKEFKPAPAEFLQRVRGARQGPVIQPDAIRRVVIPAARRTRRVAASAPPQPAPADAIAAAVRAAPAAQVQAAIAAQGPALPDVPYVQAQPPLAQATVFDVSDQTNLGFELNRMCPDHLRGPRGKKMRTHPSVAEIIGRRYGQLTSFPNDQGLRERATRVGSRIIYSFHHMLVVIVAGRILRQERLRARTLVFLEHAMNCDDPRNLVPITTQFLVDVRENVRAWYQDAQRRGEDVREPDLTFFRFAPPDTIYAIQFWICRCETGSGYFSANAHGPVTWRTVGYDACTDPDVRQSFEEHVRDFFPRAVNLVRHREYDQHVLERVTTPNRWPPMPVTFQVDENRCLWSRTVVFMDEWGSLYLSGGLRRDITAIQLPTDPQEAWKEMRRYFFAYTVERIVFIYGANALWDVYVDNHVQFFEETATHLSQNFGRARVYYFCAPYMRDRHEEWTHAVQRFMLENDRQLLDLATLVSYPLDRQLQAYIAARPDAEWPQVARLEQDDQAFLTERGIAERKSYAVVTHGLDLWSELTQEELSQEEILQIAKARVHETPRHFGRPTVIVPNFEELIKRKKKEAPPSQKQASEQTPSGSKRPAGQRKFGGRPTFEAKRGKGAGQYRKSQVPEWQSSQQSLRSEASSETSHSTHRSQGATEGTPMTQPDPASYRAIPQLQDPGTRSLIRKILDNIEGRSAPQPPPVASRTARPKQTAAIAAAAKASTEEAAPAQLVQQLNLRDRAPAPRPTEQDNQSRPAIADSSVEGDLMIVDDADVGQAQDESVLEHQDPAVPTDTVNTVTSAAENSANTGTSNEAASKTSKTGSDSSSTATSSSSPSTITTSSSESASTSTSTSTDASSGTTASSTSSGAPPRTSPSSVTWPKGAFIPTAKGGRPKKK
ncbi:hypothetical protein AAVH_21128 [Aphelenchoides avenae]|nr:hypothetical protein AAVH_21128 [Aphelenchus avenae]